MKIGVFTPVSHLPGIVDLIKSKGECYLHEEADKDTVRYILKNTGIDTIICNPNQQTYKIDRELLAGTSVKTINTCSTGLNHIDIKYCEEAGIQVLSLTRDTKLIEDLPSTSELAFGLMSSLLRSIPAANTHVLEGGWDYTPFVGHQMKGLTVGIVGLGRLGRMMRNYCKAFGMKTLVYDPYLNKDLYDDSFLLNEYQACLTKMVPKCDVISLHVHVTDETKYMINKEVLSIAKPNLIVINTSRGEIVNESDIVEAMRANKIAGYGADVLENEFDSTEKSPILNYARQNHRKTVLTPHIGGMTIEGQQKAYTWAINKL